MAIHLYLAQFHPRLQLHLSEVEFRHLAAACDQAVRAADMDGATRERISSAEMARLDQALDIARLPCKSYARLREHLLAQDVSKHALAALHLSATADPAYPDLREGGATEAELDARLRIAIERLDLTPLPLKEYLRDPKFLLGEKLFHDPRLSGYGDRTCATCHNLQNATSNADDLEPRLEVAPELVPEIPARNVPDLWNRDHNDVSAMLWDGRLEVEVAASLGGLSSPEGLDTSGFENLMALQSIRPVFSPVEMLGKPGPQNAIAPGGIAPLEPEDVLARLSQLLFTGEAEMSGENTGYQELFQTSYGLTRAEQISPAHIGNALAHYIEIEFQTRETPWDMYLTGDLEALTKEQKRGALVFFGVGRCSVCHSGNLFSDFGFHSVGVPDPREHKDLGRYYATGFPKDRFLFRTPPLRNITLTAPYFHNGQSNSLIDVVTQHLNPYRYSREYAETGAHLMEPAEIASISPILSSKKVVTREQMELLVKFLRSLEDRRAGQARN
ncbi:cytochrome c peroxidase [Pseudophaeobacter sp. 1A16562]|uniref:cytochrome-c peroxidase n=1 Tax=Pseudophaeobacter sp. 1A16562 TaxID=3098143 RepID=UPI0034D583E8